MPQNIDERELMKRILQDPNAQLPPDELNDLLEKELARPAVEMDTGLVKDVLELLREN